VLRWDGVLPDEQFQIFLKTLPLVIIIQIAFFLVGGVYRGLWRYVGMSDLLIIARAVVAGATVSTIVIFLMYWFRGPSRAVALLDLLLLLVFVTVSRFAFILLKALIVGRGRLDPTAKPVLIYGAGDGGELLIREILNNPDHRYAPVGFIDDDGRKAGKKIHGYKIFDCNDLPNLIQAYGIDEPRIPDGDIQHLQQYKLCAAVNHAEQCAAQRNAWSRQCRRAGAGRFAAGRWFQSVASRRRFRTPATNCRTHRRIGNEPADPVCVAA